jgi:hypothetical protein
MSHDMGSDTDGIVTVRFYDNAADVSMRTRAVLQDADVNRVGIGVDTPTSTAKYAYLIGTTWTATTVNRTTGWHEFKWDLTSGTNCNLYIDGVLAATTSILKDFRKIYLGDNSTGATGVVYFDSVKVNPYVLYDSFESGFSQWTASWGTPTTTAIAYDGGAAFYPNEDRDEIYADLGAGYSAIVTVMFYDNASDVDMRTRAIVHNQAFTDFAGVGVDTPTSTSKYSTNLNAAWTATTVNRSTGWHELKLVASGTDCKIYIDNVLVRTVTAVTDIRRLSLGDNSNGNTGAVYFDKVLITPQ